MIKQLRNKKGFTLIEIIVVIVILAVLMAVAVPSVLNYINEGNNAKYMSTARGAMIQAQTQLAKTYAGSSDAKDTYAAALSEAVTQTNKSSGSLTVATITAYTDTAAKAPLHEKSEGGDPSDVKSYVVTFNGDKKTATITVNGSVTIKNE